MDRPNVSVIIPVYNVAEYIERSAKSLFEQTLDSMEYIFIDDCSNDNSINILKEVLSRYPHRKNQVKIIRNDQNIGVGQSRQRGIDEASGEFIIHCDSDDWVDPEMYLTLYNAAIAADAEIATCNYCEDNGRESVAFIQKPDKTKTNLFHQFANELLHTSLWLKLIKAKLAKTVKIEKGINNWEDFSITPYLMLKANRIIYVDKVLYHYNMANLNSITRKNYTKNALSSINAINSLLRKLNEDGLTEIIYPMDIYRLQWSAKKGFLLEPSKENIKSWQNTFPESNSHYKEIGIPRKFQFLTWLAIHNHYKALQFYKKLKSIL